MTPEAEPTGGDEGRLSRAPRMQFTEVVMPAGWRILVEGEEPVVSFLRAEGETDFGIEAILEHPGPDWYTGVWLDERRGYEGQMRTVTYRDGVYRIESGPENDFWGRGGAMRAIRDRQRASAASPTGRASSVSSSHDDHRA